MLKDPIIPESIPERLHGELTPPSTPHFRPEEVTPEPKTIYDQEPCPPGDVPPSDAAPNASAHERRSNIIQRPNIHITSAHAADDEGAGAKGIAALSLSEATAHGDGVASGTDGADADIAPWENRVREAADQDGEAFVTVGPMRAAELDATLERLSEVAMTVESDYTVVHTQAGAADPASGEATVTAFAVVRKLPTQNQHLDLRVAVVGNVDAGKSTLVGVLTGPLSFLDDGRGLARSRVLRHKHEAETGRTSSIAEDQHMRLTAKGQCLALERHQKRDAVDLSEAAKVVSFIDLAGHERYLRTTVYGLTAHEPDYVMVVVGANHGITRMTKEHVGMAIALNVPLFVVVTKVDLCPEPVMRETMKQLHRLLKLPGARKQPYVVKSNDELMVAANGFGKSALCPIFCISSVDGTNVPLLRQFFNLMPSRRAWAAQDKLPTEFLIDQYFNVPGVGLVVAGTLLSGAVHVNHELLMGPNNQGKFNKVTIKSIHHMRSPVPALLPGQTGAFVVRSRTKEHVRQFGIRKGMVLLDAAASPAATRVFSCDVLVLHSQTTMRVNYQPILYARNVRQCVRICAMDKEVLRTGTMGRASDVAPRTHGATAPHSSPPAPPSTGVRARVTFEFMYRPEFLQPGTKVLFTEGKTKAIGTIVELLGAAAEEKPAAPRSTAHGHGGQGTGAGASKERKSGEADASRQ